MSGSPTRAWAPKAQRARKQWYKFIPSNCTGLTGRGRGKQCDEYPYRSTTEGGPGASLKPITARDNTDAGARLGALYILCHTGKLGTT